jgi:hypothetical protein
VATYPTTNGMEVSDLSAPPSLTGFSLELGNQVDEWYGKKVSTANDLPPSGRFAGQRVWLVDVKGWAMWTGGEWINDTGLIPVAYSAAWKNGIVGGEVSEYERRNGMVTVYLAATRDDGHAAGSPVLTLPPKFRPRRPIRGTGNNAGSGRAFSISTSGVLTMDVAQSSGGLAAFVGSITFPAAI